jgi:membrane protein
VVPAGRIRAPFAAIGALTAAAVIIALKGLLAAYFEHAFAMSRLYGSLGLVPVFMFWLWVVWMAALLGLEIGALAQTIRLRGLDAGMSSNDGAAPDPAVAVAVMDAAVIAWRAGAHVDRQAIAQRLSIDDRLAGELLESLARGGFLDRTEGDAYLPSRPPETIPVADVLRWTQRGCAGEDAVERSAPARAIRGAQEDAARHQTLA